MPPHTGTEIRKERKSSWGLKSRSEIGAEDVVGNCLFERVVRIRRWQIEGIRFESSIRRSEIEVVESNGRDNVDGRSNPGKVVARTLTIGEAIVRDISSDKGLL